MTTSIRQRYRLSRHNRVRAKISGTTEIPRVAVYKSLRFLYVQVIDDTKHETVLSVSTKDPKISTPAELGKALAEGCIKKGIKQIVFDRGGHQYAGKVKELAESARQHNLQF